MVDGRGLRKHIYECDTYVARFELGFSIEKERSWININILASESR
jgi:hypothetical protein